MQWSQKRTSSMPSCLRTTDLSITVIPMCPLSRSSKQFRGVELVDIGKEKFYGIRDEIL